MLRESKKTPRKGTNGAEIRAVVRYDIGVMDTEWLKISTLPMLDSPRLLMGFSGWMDGGDVSTGTIKYLVDKLEAEEFARIEAESFYIQNMPGSMEVSALFRPHVRIQDGLIRTYRPPTNRFYFSHDANLILFRGKEPNMNWSDFADCLFSLSSRLGVKQMYFIGSVAGLTPHTREPRISCSASDESARDLVKDRTDIRFTSYEGPGSVLTYLMTRCPDEGMGMLSLIAEIPAYVQGYNPICIETTTRLMAGLLGLHIQLNDMRTIANSFEQRLTDAINDQPELQERIHKLEHDYDNEVLDTEIPDLKTWLEGQGIRAE
jgi:predicted ATP-grasp superfamily ATP-dependent carboligase